MLVIELILFLFLLSYKSYSRNAARSLNVNSLMIWSYIIYIICEDILMLILLA